MQQTSDLFQSRAERDIRKLAWGCYISFDKTLDDSITFFTIETSTIEGGDFIKGDEVDVVQEWDKYQYSNFSDRLIDITIEKQVQDPYSVTMSMADIVLNNYDDYFTPGKGSAIDGNILPYRPIRLYMGFGDEIIPRFIGLTEKMPTIDEKNKTATFHCIDFMFSLMNKSLDESLLFTDSRTDEILDGLFTSVGLSSSQLSLDEGVNTIGYAYFPKGMKLKDAVNKLLEAEMGRLYMDEYGTITFKTRLSYDTDNVYRFNAYSHIYDIETKKEEEIINVVEVKTKAREVQPKQRYWELENSVEISPGESVDIWADFDDPVTTCDDPVYIDAATTSAFAVNTESDGSGTANSTDVTLSSSSLFSQSFKMIFTNSGLQTLYITNLELYCTPAKIVSDIYVKEQDDDSVAAYDERPMIIENDFIQNETDPQSIALSILLLNKDYVAIKKLDVKGNMSLQIDDPIEVNVFDVINNHRITKITDRISLPGKYLQFLEVKNRIDVNFFTIELSLIGGADVIKP